MTPGTPAGLAEAQDSRKFKRPGTFWRPSPQSPGKHPRERETIKLLFFVCDFTQLCDIRAPPRGGALAPNRRGHKMNLEGGQSGATGGVNCHDNRCYQAGLHSTGTMCRQISVLLIRPFARSPLPPSVWTGTPTKTPGQRPRWILRTALAQLPCDNAIEVPVKFSFRESGLGVRGSFYLPLFFTPGGPVGRRTAVRRPIGPLNVKSYETHPRTPRPGFPVPRLNRNPYSPLQTKSG